MTLPWLEVVISTEAVAIRHTRYSFISQVRVSVEETVTLSDHGSAEVMPNGHKVESIKLVGH